MKLVQGKPSPWRWDGKNMVRETESMILLNYEGHGVNSRRDTVANLVKQLAKLDQSARVCVSDDEDTGREGLYIILTETRKETPVERNERLEANRKAEESAAALAEVRARSKGIVAELQRRSRLERQTRLEGERRALEAALLDILSKLDQTTYLETFRELREEQNAVQARLAQITIELQNCNRAT